MSTFAVAATLPSKSLPCGGSLPTQVQTAAANNTLAMVSTIAYHGEVKASELKRWLEQQGCTFEQGTNHWIVRLGSRRTTIPRHPSQEIKSGTYHGILRQLDLKRK